MSHPQVDVMNTACREKERHWPGRYGKLSVISITVKVNTVNSRDIAEWEKMDDTNKKNYDKYFNCT